TPVNAHCPADRGRRYRRVSTNRPEPIHILWEARFRLRRRLLRPAARCRNTVDTVLLQEVGRHRGPSHARPRLPPSRRRGDNTGVTGLSLALANLKPGTGKTTSAVWLAHIFAQAGNDVLLVDADPSGSALEWSDLAAMYPGLPPQAAFPFRIVALPSREMHRRIPEIAQDDDVVIIDAPQLEDHAAIALSALRYADEIVIPCAPSPIEINRTSPVREEIAEVEALRD